MCYKVTILYNLICVYSNKFSLIHIQIYTYLYNKLYKNTIEMRCGNVGMYFFLFFIQRNKYEKTRCDVIVNYHKNNKYDSLSLCRRAIISNTSTRRMKIM